MIVNFNKVAILLSIVVVVYMKMCVINENYLNLTEVEGKFVGYKKDLGRKRHPLMWWW